MSTQLLLRRIALGCLTLWVVSVLIFVGTELLPGDLATALLGKDATPEALAAIRDEFGLGRPAHIRYADWLLNFLRGDMGRSLVSGAEVAPMISYRLLNTVILASTTAAFAIPSAIVLGLCAAMTENSFFDRVVTMLGLIAASVPEFFVAYVLVYLFSVQAGWLPGLSLVMPGASLGQHLFALLLPALTLTLVIVAHMMRMTRAAVINVLSSPYIEMATLKGIPNWRIVVQHALPNALAPIINVIVFNLAYLVVGVLVVEVVFAYPGLGQFMVDAVVTRDLPVVQACGVIFAATYICLNLLADILATAANPRLKRSKRKMGLVQ